MSNAVKKPSLSATTKAVRAASNVVTITAPMADYSRDTFKALCDKAMSEARTAQATFRTVCATMATLDYAEFKWARSIAKKVYLAMNPETKPESADKAIERAVKKVAPDGWKAPLNMSAKAVADRARQAEKAKAGKTKEPKVQGGQTETTKPAPAQATPYDKPMTEQEVKEYYADVLQDAFDETQGWMPESVRKVAIDQIAHFKLAIHNAYKALK